MVARLVHEAEGRAFALMTGKLQLSRVLADRQLADQVLDQGIQSTLTLLGAEHPS